MRHGPRDPTPVNPLALQLALRDPSGAAVYLARPCQFVAAPDKRECARAYWTEQRFSPAVIAASLEAISQLKQRYGAQRLVLVGYSGGGAVASLVAAQRGDVAHRIGHKPERLSVSRAKQYGLDVFVHTFGGQSAGCQQLCQLLQQHIEPRPIGV